MSNESVKEKKSKRLPGGELWIPFFLTVLTLLVFWYFNIKQYYICSVLLILYAMLPAFIRIEKKKTNAREMAILAVMCAIAVASRAAFVMIPAVKPIIGIIMITGMVFGAGSGFLVGAVSAFVSNFIFGQGPWTPWQMFAYGVAGIVAGLLARKGILKGENRLANALTGAYVVLLIVGPLLDTCSIFTVNATISGSYVLSIYLAGLPINIIHALATAVTMFVLSKPMSEILERIKMKYGITDEG